MVSSHTSELPQSLTTLVDRFFSTAQRMSSIGVVLDRHPANFTSKEPLLRNGMMGKALFVLSAYGEKVVRREAAYRVEVIQ
ncbi:MAG TPA: hypothetical protein V6C98_09710 [Thermosynechococcaceae cyanobacterium]